MALLDVDFFSESLQVGTSMTVVLPQPSEDQVGVETAQVPATDFPLLYLLHGLSDDHSAWLRYTSVERYAGERGLAVVMPAVHRSFYANERHGHAYWDFIATELPQIVGNFFRVTDDPARTFVAGLSMGGYGAMRLALTYPQRYAGAASLSGALDLRALLAQDEREELSRRIFAGDVRAEEDLLDLLARGAGPRLWVGCGTEDVLVEHNRHFVEVAEQSGHHVSTRFEAGDHEWGLWDRWLPTVMDFLLAGEESTR